MQCHTSSLVVGDLNYFIEIRTLDPDTIFSETKHFCAIKEVLQCLGNGILSVYIDIIFAFSLPLRLALCNADSFRNTLAKCRTLTCTATDVFSVVHQQHAHTGPLLRSQKMHCLNMCLYSSYHSPAEVSILLSILTHHHLKCVSE